MIIFMAVLRHAVFTCHLRHAFLDMFSPIFHCYAATFFAMLIFLRCFAIFRCQRQMPRHWFFPSISFISISS